MNGIAVGSSRRTDNKANFRTLKEIENSREVSEDNPDMANQNDELLKILFHSDEEPNRIEV